jgi:hypothetical protein
MEVFDFMEVSPNCANRTGFACAGVTDKGGVEVGVEVGGSLEPNLLLKNRRYGRDRRPLSPNNWGF